MGPIDPLPASRESLAVFTDGIERLVLDFADLTPHEPFFSSMIIPVERSEKGGRLSGLSQSLHAFLDSDKVNDRTDDDKTLILAARA